MELNFTCCINYTVSLKSKAHLLTHSFACLHTHIMEPCGSLLQHEMLCPKACESNPPVVKFSTEVKCFILWCVEPKLEFTCGSAYTDSKDLMFRSCVILWWEVLSGFIGIQVVPSKQSENIVCVKAELYFGSENSLCPHSAEVVYQLIRRLWMYMWRQLYGMISKTYAVKIVTSHYDCCSKVSFLRATYLQRADKMIRFKGWAFMIFSVLTSLELAPHCMYVLNCRCLWYHCFSASYLTWKIKSIVLPYLKAHYSPCALI